MKSCILGLALTTLLLTGALPSVAAPPLINYQGRIVVGTTNFDGTGQFKFALVDGGVNLNTQATASALVFPIDGSIFAISVTTGGSGYVSAPAVTITATGGGSGATAVATVTGGVVTSIQVTNGGSGYFAAPTVSIAPPPPNILTTTFWSNDQSSANGSEPGNAVSLPVVKGLYSVLLGDNSLGATMRTIGAPDFAHPDVRLRVWFSDDGTSFQLLSPDQRLAPAAYLADGSVTAATIEDGAITTAKIAADAIDASKVKTGAITADAIAGGAINVSHLAAQATVAGQVLGYDGTDIAWTSAGGGVWSLSGSNAYYNGGKVGIGTSTPAGALQLANGGLAITGSSSPFTGAGQGLFLERSGASGGVFAFNYTNFTPLPLLLNSPGGNVGIGNPNPQATLDVLGTGLFSSTGAIPLRVSANWGTTGVANVELTGSKPTLRWTGTDNTPNTPERSWIAHVGYGDVGSTTGLQFYTRRRTSFPSPSDTGWESKAALQTDGSFQVEGDLTATHLVLRANPGTDNVAILCNDPAVTTFVPFNTANDRQLNLIVRDASVRQLAIRGGMDLAEPFEMKEEELEKGSVVVIDDEHPGRLKRSTGAYDTRVAGIISGANGVNPGIALHQEGLVDGGQNVALSGRVYVRADATGAPIKPGDLLTTSDTPGHAMKVTEHTRVQGAVIGKAMSSLNEGTGMVLVLVTLQ